MTNNEYSKYVSDNAPKSPMLLDIAKAFLVGGLICCLGQGFSQMYAAFGLSHEDAGAASSITLIFLGALFTGLGLYDNFARFSGAGTLVPITGFANSIVAPALEFRSEGLVMGMSAKMFVIAGPVLVFGLAASVIYGLILSMIT